MALFVRLQADIKLLILRNHNMISSPNGLPRRLREGLNMLILNDHSMVASRRCLPSLSAGRSMCSFSVVFVLGNLRARIKLLILGNRNMISSRNDLCPFVTEIKSSILGYRSMISSQCGFPFLFRAES